MSKSTLHPYNIHREGYNLKALCASLPELNKFIIKSKAGRDTIDFSNPAGVLCLNQALLKHHYGIEHWNIPKGYLCPPIPGRAEYLLLVKDLMNKPKGTKIHMLDIGCGANCVYTLLAHKMFNWTCVGTEVDDLAFGNAKTIVAQNKLENSISIRLQRKPDAIFENISYKGEKFDLMVCNPPFHKNLEDARRGTSRKWKNLGYKDQKKLNFGGKKSELVYPGGEPAFVGQMIKESFYYKDRIEWFTSLVSKDENVAVYIRQLKKFNNLRYEVIEMKLGNKTSRILCWTWVAKPKKKIHSY